MGLVTSGKMSSRLLTKTLRVNMLVSAIILLLTAPLFYWITNGLSVDDADEALLFAKINFSQYTQPTLKRDEVADWNRFNRDMHLFDSDRVINQDTIYGRFFYDSLSDENEPYRVLEAPITVDGREYVFAARMNLIESEDFIASIAFLFLVLIICSIIGMYWTTRQLSKRLWRPFYETLAFVERFEVDKMEPQPALATGIAEFDRLNQSIHKLIQNNISIFAAQREFVESAAHELQTPLAIIQGKIEAMMQRQDLTEGQGEMLEKLENAVGRLLRLNKSLLLLSKLESKPYTHADRIGLHDLIASQLEFFTEQALPRQIKIVADLQGQQWITANHTLTEVAISNLLLNALQHNIVGGQVLVSLRDGTLRIANTGQPIALPQQQLFTRFAKMRGTTGGNGLGLSIVRKIADISGWRSTYAYTQGMHVFEIQF